MECPSFKSTAENRIYLLKSGNIKKKESMKNRKQKEWRKIDPNKRAIKLSVNGVTAPNRRQRVFEEFLKTLVIWILPKTHLKRWSEGNGRNRNRQTRSKRM